MPSAVGGWGTKAGGDSVVDALCVTVTDAVAVISSVGDKGTRAITVSVGGVAVARIKFAEVSYTGVGCTGRTISAGSGVGVVRSPPHATSSTATNPQIMQMYTDFCFANRFLLIAECIDWVEAAGAVGWVNAKKQADRHGEKERSGNGI